MATPSPENPSPPAPSAPPALFGLVLAGGESSRMRTDKALLAYHGKPQALRAFELLSGRCERVFLSCRADQAGRPGLEALPRILDTHPGLGPLDGILTALEAHPGAAWLVAACDLPYLDEASVARLVSGRDPSRLATAFAGAQRAKPAAGQEGGDRHGPRNTDVSMAGPAGLRIRDLPDLTLGPDGEFPEPLFAIYEPAMGPRIRELMALGLDCPRRAIVKSPCRLLPAPDPGFLANVNLPEEYRRAVEDLSRPSPPSA